MVDVGVGLGGEDRSGLQCVVFACEVKVSWNACVSSAVVGLEQ